MKLTDEQKLRTYRSIALQLEMARIDKGWSLEEASIQIREPLKFLLKLEFGLDAIHNLRIGNLLKLASDYDKLVRVELVDAPQPKENNL